MQNFIAGFAQVLENLESPGNFVEVLESPGIWTYRSTFLIKSIHEFSHYTSSEIWVLKVCEFIEKVLEFDIGKSWNLRCQNEHEPCIGWPNILWATFTVQKCNVCDEEYFHAEIYHQHILFLANCAIKTNKKLPTLYIPQRFLVVYGD